MNMKVISTFNLPIYTDRISELIQAKILKNPSLSLVKT